MAENRTQFFLLDSIIILATIINLSHRNFDLSHLTTLFIRDSSLSGGLVSGRSIIKFNRVKYHYILIHKNKEGGVSG